MSMKLSSSQEKNLGTPAIGSNFPRKFPLDVFRPLLDNVAIVYSLT